MLHFLRYYIFTLILTVFIPSNIRAQFVQQGNKLVGSGAIVNALQGWSVAISGDGNTAIIGGPNDGGDSGTIGAAWIFVRSGGVWVQQGGKLVGSGAITWAGYVQQGYSVALSSDGNTAIIGGHADQGGVGAAWVFVRSHGVWTQQGYKLVGNDYTGSSAQGYSVSISGDGNTVMVGGVSDNGNVGAAWVFTRTSGSWKQQGNKLVGSGYSMQSYQGASVALSANGNTAIVGGWGDSSWFGAAWVFTRSGGVWTQQGEKLVGSGAVGFGSGYDIEQGRSVSLSVDGNTAIVGGCADDSLTGAAWIFIRQGSTWRQQGEKLVGTGASAGAGQGCSVSLSGDGNTAIVGGASDNSIAPFQPVGAAWIYKQRGGAWTQEGVKLVGIGFVGGSSQGLCVAISANGSTAIVGGPRDSSYAGAAWVYIDTTLGEFSPINLNDFWLSQNYPNPFNPTTHITYSLPENSHVSLTIFDLLGREVVRLVQEYELQGEYSVSWNAAGVSSGVYYYQLIAGPFVQAKKMVVIK